MSTETETRENQVPPEVAALWTQLHAEAIRRRDDLKPATSRRWLAAVGAIATAVVALVIVGALIARQSDQRRTQATITAVAVAAATTQLAQQAALETRETQVAGTATADWNALQARQTETSIALARATEATATEAAKVTETAQATATAAAIATATAIACLQDDLFAARVAETPRLQPAPTYEWVTDKSIGFISASWVVTNTGECAWEQLTLSRTSGSASYDFEPIGDVIPPGGRTELMIQFREAPSNPVNASWVIVANGKPLLDERGGQLSLDVGTWIIAITPTPTPTFTPSPTPTPTATPIPRVGNLVAREPQGSRYMSEGVVFEWTYDTELETFFRFQILARGPNNIEYPLPIPASCEPYELQDNNYHRCTVRNAGLLPVDGSYTWSVRVIDATDQMLAQSSALSFDLSRRPSPTDTPPEPEPPPSPGTRTP